MTSTIYMTCRGEWSGHCGKRHSTVRGAERCLRGGYRKRGSRDRRLMLVYGKPGTPMVNLQLSMTGQVRDDKADRPFAPDCTALDVARVVGVVD